MFKIALTKLLQSAGVNGEIVFSSPPKSEMGDLAFACFDIAKVWQMSPADAAKKIADKINVVILSKAKDLDFSALPQNDNIVQSIKIFGPYLI